MAYNMSKSSKADAGDIIIIKSRSTNGIYYYKVQKVVCDKTHNSKPKYFINDRSFVDEDQILDCFTPYSVGQVIQSYNQKLTISGIDYGSAVYTTVEGIEIPLNEHWLWTPVD